MKEKISIIRSMRSIIHDLRSQLEMIQPQDNTEEHSGMAVVIGPFTGEIGEAIEENPSLISVENIDIVGKESPIISMVNHVLLKEVKENRHVDNDISITYDLEMSLRSENSQNINQKNDVFLSNSNGNSYTSKVQVMNILIPKDESNLIVVETSLNEENTLPQAIHLPLKYETVSPVVNKVGEGEHDMKLIDSSDRSSHYDNGNNVAENTTYSRHLMDHVIDNDDDVDDDDLVEQNDATKEDLNEFTNSRVSGRGVSKVEASPRLRASLVDKVSTVCCQFQILILI